MLGVALRTQENLQTMKYRRALVSVADKTGVAELCHRLAPQVGEFVASSGTATMLAQSGIPVLKVDELGTLPEMLGGRVKTLQPQIHGGILAHRNDDHLTQLAVHGIKPIDLVIVNLYPFGTVVAKSDATWEEAIENIDIGGVALMRAAAKNHAYVSVLVDPKDYAEFMRANAEDKVDLALRRKLACKAFALTATYDQAIFSYLRSREQAAAGLPETIMLNLELREASRYGENPHQQGGVYSQTGADLPFVQLHGKAMSFNNWLDLDGAWQVIQGFAKPTVAIVKHGNPCGMASGDTLAEAYEAALASDPVSAFGSAVSCNQTVDADTAALLSQLFVEVLVAPDYDPIAFSLLAKRKNIRLLQPQPVEVGPWRVRGVEGGYLVQERDDNSPDLDSDTWICVTAVQPSADQMQSLAFAWRVVKHVKSNAIVFVQGEATVGIGAGQMSRLDSVHMAAVKAGERARNAAMASDAFFPFPDGIEMAAAAGIKAIVQPGGSLRDKAVIETANRLDLCMMFTGHRHFLH